MSGSLSVPFSLVRVIAQTAGVNCNQNTVCDTGLPTVAANPNALQFILQIAFGVIGAVALLIILIAALRFVISNGNPETVSRARNTIIYAAVGLVAAVSAELIVTFVLTNV